MKLNTAYLTLKTNSEITENTTKLRGFIGNKFKNYPLLHNHFMEGKSLYTYPLIQYQILGGQASIFAIEEGVKTLKDISGDIDELKLGKSYYKVNEKIIIEKEVDIRPTNTEHHYKFLSPWLALNTTNYSKFNEISNWKDKKLFLNKILIGNILSMCKSFGIIVNREIYPKTHLDEISVEYKAIPMKAFLGEFKIRFKVPDFFGLGKGVSHGFGTIKEITKCNE